MSEDWEEKKLYPEEGPFDSGLGDSVQSFQDEGIHRSLGPPKSDSSHLHGSRPADKLCEDTEQLDSSYGSSSIIEGLPPTGLPEPGDPASQPTPETLTLTSRVSLDPDIVVAKRAQETGTLPPMEDITLLGSEPGPQTASLPEAGGAQPIDSLAYMSEEGDTLLHLSIIHGIVQLSLYFISLAPPEVLDIQNDLYQSPLHLAVYLEQLEVVKALVGKGVSLELQDRKGDTPLHLACENQHLECSRALLRGPRGPQNLQLQNWKGLSCLHVATMKRNVPLISLLLENGADINSQEGTSGKTALHLAVEMADAQLLAHLLHYRPHVDALMYNGCTPLHLAVGRKDSDLARLLCHSGADILQRNREGETPQDLAEGNNQLLALLPFDDLMISGKPVVTTA